MNRGPISTAAALVVLPVNLPEEPSGGLSGVCNPPPPEQQEAGGDWVQGRRRWARQILGLVRKSKMNKLQHCQSKVWTHLFVLDLD